MAKLIDMEEAISELKKLLEQCEKASPRRFGTGSSVTALRFFIGWLEKRPVVDLATVVYARWVPFRSGDWTSVYECSKCHRMIAVSCDKDMVVGQVKKMYPYCHCGAKMDIKEG